MVDFANSNLCGASPEMNDVFKKLDEAASEIESKIDAAASEAKAAFETAQNELNNLTAKLQSIEIPELPKLNLQAEIKGLSELTPGTPAYLSSLATITNEFEADLAAAGKDLGTLINDGLSAITSGGNICAAIPNIEKEAGSDNPATEKAVNVLQAAVAPLTETVSTVTQNADITTQTEEIEVDVAAAQTPLKTEATPLEEDAGAYSMVPEEQVKTISTDTGETKVVPKKVEKPEERKNVAPKSKSDGFTHRISTKTEHFSDRQITLSAGNEGMTEVVVELENVPIRASIKITQYNLFETEVTTYETTSIGADGKPILGYRETYGIHGEDIVEQTNFHGRVLNRRRSRPGQRPASASANGKKLTILTPYSIFEDHPGDLESIILRGKGKRFSLFKGGMRAPKAMGHNYPDKRLNKRFKGRLFTVSYKYRESYDPEPST